MKNLFDFFQNILKIKQKIIKEQNTFLNWLCNSFILFKLFDLQTDQTYHEILHDIITKTRGQIYIHNKDEFIESLKPLQPIIDLLINKGEIKNNEIPKAADVRNKVTKIVEVGGKVLKKFVDFVEVLKQFLSN